MTSEQCRKIEAMYFSSGRCDWPEDDIAKAIDKWNDLICQLEAGKKIDNGEGMGSCECGDINSMLFLKDGIVWCVSAGNMAWQCYDGPAAMCNVPYGVGKRARQLAAAFDARETVEVA